ncbi:MAG: PIG-L family deacetylase [Streptosporangiaceae bacterium]
MAGQPGTGTSQAQRPGGSRPGHSLPGWASVLAVVAHPDDESFGLGAVIDLFAQRGAAVHILCYTHGEASTLNESGADLRRAREAELREAAAVLGAASVTLSDYPDGHLAAVAPARLAAEAGQLARQHQADGLLVFDDTGITGHPDHQAATRAAMLAAGADGLPVLAWTLPAQVADQLRAETGQPFAGRVPGDAGVCVRVGRARQREAALLHASQISPTAVLWRRLQLQGECEHLRWLLPPRPLRDLTATGEGRADEHSTPRRRQHA